MRNVIIIFMLFVISFTFSGCSGISTSQVRVEEINVEDQADTGSETGSKTMNKQTSISNSSELVQPSDLKYMGAFRLPDMEQEAPEGATWEYGGRAMTYYPDGERNGPDDGYPGSIFATGFDIYNYVSEITIPVPVISPTKNLDELNTAETLQPFSDVSGGLFASLAEIPRVGMQYLSTSQTGDKIHLAWGQHFQEEEGITIIPSHVWIETDLSNPQTKGAWWIGNQSLYSVNGYIFEIPKDWADTYIGGRYLATGRFRDGGWSGQGPSLLAYAPWLSGNPPEPGTRLSEIPLLLYSSTRSGDQIPPDYKLNDYQHPDEWEGGAWLTTASKKSSVIFVGTKGTGDFYWYGWLNPDDPEKPCVETEITDMVLCHNADGTPASEEISKGCDNHTSDRGWWSSKFNAQIIFYDPANFAAVADGKMQPYEPQPYAAMNIDEYLFLSDPTVEFISTGTGEQRRYRMGETCYDRDNGLLYVFELFADGAKPVVHVWGVQ